ncbi:MAG: hypothetical protein M5T52_19845 [Ignavibacteriaceae bacterium]|nr:hypothetical protein [Ignavibacteriaceae bacterium]
MRILKISLMVFILSITISAQNAWQQTNGPYGGGVTSFAVGGTMIFAGTYDGIFRSTNDGQDWIGVNTGLSNTIISSFYCK